MTTKNKILVFNSLPLSLEKILDQININLIKQKYHSQSKLIINSYDLDLNSKIFSNKRFKLKLTEKEAEIILVLNKEKKAIKISTLQSQIWGYSVELETHTVETHIYRLRKKIKDTFDDDNFIINSKEGYRIIS
jgi:DNA-binding response OmpR family regulator